MDMNLVVADKKYASQICFLVNIAYRGTRGWTKETDIVAGNRVTLSDVESILSNPDAHVLVAMDGNEVMACICVEQNENNAYIGMFSVHPDIQGKGIGKEILLQAERFAAKTLRAEKFVMVVVSQRKELISYYERRGYFRTGVVEAYPLHLNVGVPKTEGLTIEYLEKSAQ
jgi:GNAT superfamily N-acetyltransferase